MKMVYAQFYRHDERIYKILFETSKKEYYSIEINNDTNRFVCHTNQEAKKDMNGYDYIMSIVELMKESFEHQPYSVDIESVYDIFSVLDEFAYYVEKRENVEMLSSWDMDTVREFINFLSPIRDSGIDDETIDEIDDEAFGVMVDEWNATAKKLVQAFRQFFRNEEKEEKARTANNNTLVMLTEDIGDAFHEGELYVMLGESDNMCVLMDENSQLKYIPKKFVKIGASPFASA